MHRSNIVRIIYKYNIIIANTVGKKLHENYKVTSFRHFVTTVNLGYYCYYNISDLPALRVNDLLHSGPYSHHTSYAF